MINTLDDFIVKFGEIANSGWIKTHRTGNTGIGKTLEDLLGIPENNLDQPDFGDYELKSARIESNSMLTMFTKSPLPRGVNTQLRKSYGYSSGNYANTNKVLHATLNTTGFTPIQNTGYQLKIEVIDNKIVILDNLNNYFAYWDPADLQKTFEQKYKNKFVYAYADTMFKEGIEHFQYKEAYECYGFDYNSFLSLLLEGGIYIDLRIGQHRNGKTHDHGTAFRIRQEDQHRLFKARKIYP